MDFPLPCLITRGYVIKGNRNENRTKNGLRSQSDGFQQKYGISILSYCGWLRNPAPVGSLGNYPIVIPSFPVVHMGKGQN